MMFLLFLFIVPAAIGVYFLLKPPIDVETETDLKAVANVVTPYIGYEDVSNSAVTGSSTMMRKQTVNE